MSIYSMFDRISDREAFVLCARFGIGRSRLTLAEVGKLIGVGKARVAAIEQKALRTLRRPACNPDLLAFLSIESVREELDRRARDDRQAFTPEMLYASAKPDDEVGQE